MPVQKIDLPKLIDERGNLTFLQCPQQVPFPVKRVFWAYGIPGGGVRGGHAYKTQEEIIVALSGSFDIVINLPGGGTEQISLNRSYYGVYVPALTWRHIENYSTNALSLHLSSTEFSREDYLWDFESWRRLANAQ